MDALFAIQVLHWIPATRGGSANGTSEVVFKEPFGWSNFRFSIPAAAEIVKLSDMTNMTQANAGTSMLPSVLAWQRQP
jgi:hypothetical protein